MSKKTTNKPTIKKARLPFEFKGISSPNYTQVPDEILDFVIPFLSGAETKVLLYIIRRTFGFKKDSDRISLRQLVNGITTYEGKILDYGTGLSKVSVVNALKGLVDEIGIVKKNKLRTDERGDESNTYSLNLIPQTVNELPPVADKKTRVQKLNTPRVQKTDTPRVQKLNTQETEEQKTAKQETEETTTTGTSQVEGSNKKTVVASLVDFGIAKSIAEKLASQNKPLYLQQKLDYAMFLLDHAPEKIKNPNGWLRRAIELDYGEPDGFISQTDIEAQQEEIELEAQRQEELAQLEAARQQKKAQLEAEKYQQWRDDLSNNFGTTAEDFELWKQAQTYLSMGFSQNATGYSMFVANAEILKVTDDTVKIGLASDSAKQMLLQRSIVVFERDFKTVCHKPMKIEIVVVGRPEPVSEEIEVENEVTIVNGQH